MSTTEPQRRIWDVDRYEAAAEAGAFGPSPKVELIDGEVFTVPPMDEPHAWSTRTLLAMLSRGSWAIPEQMVQVATGPDPATQTCRSVRLARPGDDLIAPEAGLVIPVSSIL